MKTKKKNNAELATFLLPMLYGLLGVPSVNRKIPWLKGFIQVPLPLTEGLRMLLERLTEELAFLVKQLDEIELAVERNNACRPSSPYAKKRPLENILGILLPPILIVLFTAVSITALTKGIQANSIDGNLWSAISVAISIWTFSAALKYFVAPAGPLERWKWLIEIVMGVVLLISFCGGIFEICRHYMVVEVITDAPLNFDFALAGAASATEEVQTLDFKFLYLSLTLLEAVGVYGLTGMFLRNMAPPHDPKDLKIDADNEKLRRREVLIRRKIPKLRSRIAALEERKRQSEAPTKALEALLEKFSK